MSNTNLQEVAELAPVGGSALSAAEHGVTPGIERIEHRFGVMVKMDRNIAVMVCEESEVEGYVQYCLKRGRIVQPFHQTITTRTEIISLPNV